MAFDEVTICHVLGLLDRLSSKTLNRAVLQFEDHKERFYESLSELKSLILPTGECIVKDNALLKLNLGGDTHSQRVQSKCTHLNSPQKLTVVQEGIENYGSQHTLQSQIKCSPLKPLLNATVDQGDIENYGSKKYSLRTRAPRKLSMTNAPQRITRARAKQPAAAKCDAFEPHITVVTQKLSPCLKSEYYDGVDKAQSNSCKRKTTFELHVTPSTQKQSPCLKSDGYEGVDVGQSNSCKRKTTFELHVTPSTQKQSPCLKSDCHDGVDVRQFNSRKRKNTVCEVFANASGSCHRISLSYKSPLFEAFKFDEFVVHIPYGGGLSLCNPRRTTCCERASTPITDAANEQKEGSHEVYGLVQKDPSVMALKVADENLLQALGDVAGSSSLFQMSNSKVMECIISSAHDEKSTLPESAEVITNGLTPRCEQIEIVATHEVEPHDEGQLKVLEHTSSFVLEQECINGFSSPVYSAATLQVEQAVGSSHNKEVSLAKPANPCVYEHTGSFMSEQEYFNELSPPVHSAATLQAEQGVGSLHNKEVSLVKPAPPCLHEHVEENLTFCLRIADTSRGVQVEDYDNQQTACKELGNLILNGHSNLGLSSGSFPARLQLEENGMVSLFHSDSPQEALQAAASASCQLAEGSLTSNLNLAQHSGEAHVVETLSKQPSFIIHSTSPVLSPKGEEASDIEMEVLMPQLAETKNRSEVKLENPVADCESLWKRELCRKSPSKIDPSDRLPFAVSNRCSMEPPKGIQDPVTKEGVDHKIDIGDDNSDTESQMDCSESPRPCYNKNEEDANERNSRKIENPNDLRVTPKDDNGFLKFTQLLAQGTVNSSRRKRARSPAICTEESSKEWKKMKLLSTGKAEQFQEKGLPHALSSQSPNFGRSNSSMYGFPYCSPVRRFQDTFGLTFGDSGSKSFDKGDFHSLQRKIIMASGNLSKSYSKLPTLRKDYLDTPHIGLLRAGLVGKSSKQKLECPLITHFEEDGKENRSPENLYRDSDASILSDWQVPADRREVLGHANNSFGVMDSPHKRYNLGVGTGSFLHFIQQKQLPLPHAIGKREVRVKALEAAELARKQEEQREIERKKRRLECFGAKGVDSEAATDKLQGITNKVKRVAELKIKMDQEKARKQEMEQRKKEVERKKKEAELADKKRKRENADRRDREEKRKRVEEVQRLQKEQEERQRVELNEKELKRKFLEERERERKAHDEEAKRQRRLEKEKEAERRRKQDEHYKAARFAEKQAERKRKEAILLQARGNEDDEFIAQIPLGSKLSILSTESFAVSTSNDWEAQGKSLLGTTRIQTSGDNWGPGVHLSTSAICQDSSVKLVESGLSASPKQAIRGLSSNCEPFKSLSYTTPSYTKADVQAPVPAQLIPSEGDIQSYEISPYRSSSDDEDDEKPKKPVPLWARKENLLQQLLWQQSVNPDHIFSSSKTCSLAEIFGTTGSRRCKDFTKRSASGDWLDDHATWKEELDYKHAMGYM
ncbi:hypothetical protein L7F22_001215 [Adiantum nelumboides]|nr:hypothetical protein [Adiantum nelumboides]